ncbi:MAG: nucleotidyltransferase family protein [Chromatiales bacterium]
MRAMILAAGRGERMRPLTDTLPKPLLEVGDKPLIVWHLERLAAIGVTDIAVNLCWLGEKIRARLGDGNQWGVRLHYSLEPPGALETGGGIFRALPMLGDEPFIVVNGDIFCDFDPSQLKLSPQDVACLVMVPNPSHNRAGDFVLRDGRLVDEGGEGLTFSGIAMYRKSLFDGCEDGVFPLAPLLRSAIARGRVAALLHTGLWRDVGTPQRLSELDVWIRERPDG